MKLWHNKLWWSTKVYVIKCCYQLVLLKHNISSSFIFEFKFKFVPNVKTFPQADHKISRSRKT